MSTYKKYIKNIYKQYGKNIKVFEDVVLEMNIPKEIEDLYNKHKLNLSNRNPMVSIIHKRWGFPNREENKIQSYEDIERIGKEGNK